MNPENFHSEADIATHLKDLISVVPFASQFQSGLDALQSLMPTSPGALYKSWSESDFILPEMIAGDFPYDLITGNIGGDLLRRNEAFRSFDNSIGGDDLIYGGFGNDLVEDTSVKNILVGGESKSSVYENDGNDLLINRLGDDSLIENNVLEEASDFLRLFDIAPKGLAMAAEVLADLSYSEIYQSLGGIDGILGSLVSNLSSIGDGWIQDFQGGAILGSFYGLFPVFGGVGYQYLHFEGGPEGRLGYPTSTELGLGNGVITQNFENGQVLYGNGPTRTLIGGQELAVGYDGASVNFTYTGTFDRAGGWDVVGSAVNNVGPWGSGYTQNFEGGSDGFGAIMKSNANNNSYWVGGDSWLMYLQAGGADGILGYPTSDRYSMGDGWIQDFQGGAILGSSYGLFPVFGGVGYQYLHFEGGPEGRLGYPTSTELGLGNGVITQNFENGQVLYGNGPTRTLIGGQELAVGYDGVSVNFTYTGTFDRAGGWDVVGSAVNNVGPWGSGYTQNFEGGSDGFGAIMKSNANNDSHWVGGDFWSDYLNTGGADGILGYPTSDRYVTVNGALRQNFQGGAIYKTAEGIFTVFGGIGDYYLSMASGEFGILGLPKSGEIGIGNGVIRQNFEGGYVLWNGTAVGYKNDDSLLYPPNSNDENTDSGISYQEYLSLLYRDDNGGYITQSYEQHGNAIDSADNDGNRRIYALTGGEVQYIGKDQYGGNYIKVWNSNLGRNFFYVHFEYFNPDLKIGQIISQGEYLGFEGTTGLSTGIHTHVHVTKENGERENPLIALGILIESEDSVSYTPGILEEAPLTLEYGYESVDDAGRWRVLLDKRNDDFGVDKSSLSLLDKIILYFQENEHYDLANSWDLLGYADAASMLRYYLNKGNEAAGYDVDLDRILSDVPAIEQVYSSLFESHALPKVARAISEGFSSGELRSDWESEPYPTYSRLSPASLNWELAMGGIHRRYEASWNLIAPATVDYKIKFYLKDVFDFEGYAAEPILGTHALHKAGWARAFEVTGESIEYTRRYINGEIQKLF